LHIALVHAAPDYAEEIRKLLSSGKLPWSVESYGDTLALETLHGTPPDLVLLGDGIPQSLDYRKVLRIKACLPDVPLVVYSPRPDPKTFFLFIMAGADGWLHQPPAGPECQSAICEVLSGEFPLSREARQLLKKAVRDGLAFEACPVHLTTQEKLVLGCLFRATVLKDVADALGIGLGTAHTHVNSLMRKLEVHRWQDIVPKYLLLRSLAQKPRHV
jgi:DNA-binding NarL/FixJ family response regulator